VDGGFVPVSLTRGQELVVYDATPDSPGADALKLLGSIAATAAFASAGTAQGHPVGVLLGQEVADRQLDRPVRIVGVEPVDT
jgi:hypothetical protein